MRGKSTFPELDTMKFSTFTWTMYIIRIKFGGYDMIYHHIMPYDLNNCSNLLLYYQKIKEKELDFKKQWTQVHLYCTKRLCNI